SKLGASGKVAATGAAVVPKAPLRKSLLVITSGLSFAEVCSESSGCSSTRD
ncbi:MAG: hypothetical protein QG570_135, partial [Patescibacteria group bacterium]|nr:hypothetical protein [Patescibacteria group bacterium]